MTGVPHAEARAIATLLGDATRLTILWALLDGKARTASELAWAANASAQNTSMHLRKLLDAGLLHVIEQGRHRYFTLASPRVAMAVESFAALGAMSTEAREVPSSTPETMRFARTCYDHLAGALAIDLLGGLTRQGLLAETEREFSLTPAGERWCVQQGIDAGALRRRRRAFAPKCLDWSERKPHMAGSLGAALLEHLLARKYVERTREHRVLRLTPAGAQALRPLL
ncbi:MAG: winged helix-turn-helix transcriptional regulator [Burkholderiales bacterium]|nr:winged helix-turn-helix transcriptional regulator [Burkholderiales bacterium]